MREWHGRAHMRRSAAQRSGHDGMIVSREGRREVQPVQRCLDFFSSVELSWLVRGKLVESSAQKEKDRPAGPRDLTRRRGRWKVESEKNRRGAVFVLQVIDRCT